MKRTGFVLLLIFCMVNVFFAHAETIGNGNLNMKYAQVTSDGEVQDLYEGPDNTTTVIEKIPNNTIIPVVLKSDIFCEVIYKGESGFVTTKSLDFIESLPFRTLSKGDYGQDIVEMKKKLQELGYFRKNDTNYSRRFSSTTEERVKIFQKANNLEVTGILSPEAQAFILWGPAENNTLPLPWAPIYKRPTNPTSDLSVQITSCTCEYVQMFSNTSLWYVTRLYYDFSISGGNEPYISTCAVYSDEKLEVPPITANGDIYFSNPTPDEGKTYRLVLTIMDADGNTSTAETTGKIE